MIKDTVSTSNTPPLNTQEPVREDVVVPPHSDNKKEKVSRSHKDAMRENRMKQDQQRKALIEKLHSVSREEEVEEEKEAELVKKEREEKKKKKKTELLKKEEEVEEEGVDKGIIGKIGF